jgi:hypothetical protein
MTAACGTVAERCTCRVNLLVEKYRKKLFKAVYIRVGHRVLRCAIDEGGLVILRRCLAAPEATKVLRLATRQSRSELEKA